MIGGGDKKGKSLKASWSLNHGLLQETSRLFHRQRKEKVEMLKKTNLPFPANNEQIDKAKAIVKAINFKYSPDNFDNPSLQKHYANIEAMALDRDAPEETEDLTCEFVVIFCRHQCPCTSHYHMQACGITP